MRTAPSSLSGFSLLEILVVLAMIALLATLSVINLRAIYDGADTIPAEEMLQMAVKESRFQAMRERETVFLSYNPKTASFEVQSRSGFVLVSLRTDHDPKTNPLQVSFLQPVPLQGLPEGFGRGRDPELNPISRVAFSPSLAATPFIVRLSTAGESSAYRFDPFSNVRLEAYAAN